MEQPNLDQEFSTVNATKSKFPIKKVAIGVVGLAVLVAGLGVGLYLVRQNQDIESGATRTPHDVTCPITATDTLQVYSFGGYGVRGDKEGTIGPIPSNILPGEYKITLVAADLGHPGADSQPNESYYVKFYNASNAEIAQSGKTPDLPDQDQVITSVVNGSITFNENVTGITAIHADWQNSNSVNSIHPVCIGIEKLSEKVTLQCNNVKVYDKDFNLLTSGQLKSLSAGDQIKVAVSGGASSGSFDKAQFTINGVQRPEVSSKKSGTQEIYDEYTIPDGVTQFTIKAQIHHKEENKWL